MGRYEIKWTDEQWFRVVIEAESGDDALLKFSKGEYENEEMFGAEIQDSLDIRLLDDQFEEEN